MNEEERGRGRTLRGVTELVERIKPNDYGFFVVHHKSFDAHVTHLLFKHFPALIERVDSAARRLDLAGDRRLRFISMDDSQLERVDWAKGHFFRITGQPSSQPIVFDHHAYREYLRANKLHLRPVK